MTSEERRSGDVAVVVLAAGLSSRMGRPKQLIRFEGKTLLAHVVDAAAASLADEVVVVLGHRAAEARAAISTPPERVRMAVNPEYERGQASSLVTGLRACSDPVVAAAIILGDQPRIVPSMIDAAIEAWRGSDRSAVRTLYRGTPGHPVVLGRDVWDLIYGEGDEGARALLAARRDLVADLEVDVEPPIDVDTPPDVDALGHRP